MSKNNRIDERLKNFQKQETAPTDKKDVLRGILHQEEEKPDLAQIAKELQERHENEAHGENEGYVKDTIYIREDIYKAFNALCVKRGDKKKNANQAFEDFILRKYAELKAQK